MVVARGRIWTIAAIALLLIGSWGYTVHLALGVTESAAMPMGAQWGITDFSFMFFMWSVMMVAMMLPSAAPMILLFGKVGERRHSMNRRAVAPAVFILGYLIVWTAFSLAATLLNWLLHSFGLLTSMMGRAMPLVSGGLLVAAGVFQWTPLKHACLERCRSPIGFLTAEWREGKAGALQMGLRHGAYCVGCCWLLMALLFVLGVMNLVWIAGLAIFVLLEKLVPNGVMLSRATGVLLVAWGVVVAST